MIQDFLTFCLKLFPFLDFQLLWNCFVVIIVEVYVINFVNFHVLVLVNTLSFVVIVPTKNQQK